jgi:probable addiction module antidote protein
MKNKLIKPKVVKIANKKKARQCGDYHEALIGRLKDREYAIMYLNAALEEGLHGDSESQKVFLAALRNVAEAQGAMSDLATRSNVRRESLYRMLSRKGNPELSSLASILNAMGFSLGVR